jgi:hypothetical protein
MKSFFSISLLCAALLFFASCSREDYRAALVGTWEWTGDACGTDGNCRKEIITDEENREVFTGDGWYLSKRMRTGYVVKGAKIRLSSEKNSFNTVYGEILSIKNGSMMLKKDTGTRRYRRVDGAR